MPYTLSKPLSDNEYNAISNASTIEDLNNIKSLLLSALQASQTNDYSNKIIVRLLSPNEFNNYIKSNTFNGTITAKDKNVWHWFDSLSLYGIIFSGSYVNPQTYNYPSQCFKNLKNNNRRVYSASEVSNLYAGGYKAYDYNAYISHYAENTSSNTRNNAYLTSISGIYDCQGYDSTSVGSYTTEPYYVSINITNSTLSKSTTNNTYSIKSNCRTGNNGYVAMTIYSYATFRPVFQYVDNRKSTNIYS